MLQKNLVPRSMGDAEVPLIRHYISTATCLHSHRRENLKSQNLHSQYYGLRKYNITYPGIFITKQ
jgi:hypothetical protein